MKQECKREDEQSWEHSVRKDERRIWRESKAHGIKQTLKPLRLEQDRKGMNKRISATLRLKMEGLEHELHPMRWHLMRWTKQCLRKNWKNGMKRTYERTTTSTTNEFDSILRGRVEWSCWDIQQRKNKLVVDLSKTTQNLRWNYTTSNVWIAEKNEACKTPLQKKTENYLHFEMREEKILELLQQKSWWTLEEWIKSLTNHHEQLR